MILLSDGHNIITYGARYKEWREHDLVMQFNNIVEDYFRMFEIPYVRITADYRCADEIVKLSSKKLTLTYKVSYINYLCQYIDNPIAIETHFNKFDGIDNDIGVGYEIIHYPTSEVSKNIALNLLDELQKFDIVKELRNRGAKGGDFAFVRDTICPALIIEPFFLDDDIEFLLDRKMFEALAVAWAHSIEKIYKGGVLK